MIDPDVEVKAAFFSRWLTVGLMKEILSMLDDSDVIVPNYVGNLSILDKEGQMLGYIDFQEEGFEEV